MMEVRFVKLIEINNLLSDGKCSDERRLLINKNEM